MLRIAGSGKCVAGKHQQEHDPAGVRASEMSRRRGLANIAHTAGRATFRRRTVVTVIAATSPESGFEPEIRTAAGVLRGRVEAGLAVFRGISYAEPPVGALRFAAPREVSAWAGVRPAYSFGPQPPQPAFGIDASGQESSSDDWLTLNVWSPDAASGAGLPVLVWIPGGAYVIGASSFPEFDGARLASGGVVGEERSRDIAIRHNPDTAKFAHPRSPIPVAARSTGRMG